MSEHKGDCVFSNDFSDCCDLGCGKTWYHSTIENLKKQNEILRNAVDSIRLIDLLGSDNQGKMASIAREALKKLKDLE